MYSVRLTVVMMRKMNRTTSIQERTTPQWLLDYIREAFGSKIALDPCHCATALTNPLKAYTEADDGLASPWNVDGLVFVNPPYKKVMPWIEKALEETSVNKHIVFLLNACTDTKWFHHALDSGASVCLLKGRLKFGPVFKTTHMYPSILLYFGPSKSLFSKAFSPIGFVPK